MFEGYAIEILSQDSAISTCRGRRKGGEATVLLECFSQTGGPRARGERLRQARARSEELDLPFPKPLELLEGADGITLVMRDPGGRTLESILRAGRLDLESAVTMAAAIARALAKLCAHGLVHEDLAPKSVLVDDTSSVWLLRLAFVAPIDHAARMAVETPEGTLAYMSPERTGRMGRAPDHRADLYSLGALFYEMVTGVPPFVEADPAALVFAHLARPPRPPREVEGSVPAIVSDIILKLLAKSADDRYQSATGLAADLEACLEQLGKTGTIEPFPLGSRDRPMRVAAARTLHGRRAEREALASALKRAREGGREIFLVEGAAGMGKTALVLDAMEATGADDAYFVAGKFALLTTTPHAGLGQALRELVQQALAEPEHVLETLRADLERELGPNTALLGLLVPELGALLGPMSDAPELGPIESQNRFAHSVQRFVDVFTKKRPLVIFLDDLQWADPASFKLLLALLVDSSVTRLLVIGTVRSEEMGDGDALRRFRADLEEQGVARTSVELGPLGPSEIRDMVADSLGFAPDDVEALSELLWNRTQGNPFFVSQLLEALVSDGLVGIDARTGAPRVDLSLIAEVVTEDVLDLLVQRVRRLDANAQRTLALAAAMGSSFPLDILAALCQRPSEDVHGALSDALRENLLLVVGMRDKSGGESGTEAGCLPVQLRFLHDRVQQAAYSLLGEEERPCVHLAIGRLLRDARKADTDEGLFDVLSHLSRGASCMVDAAERLETARLCLLGGRKAKSSAAYEAAVEFFALGMELLGEAGFEQHHDLAFSLGRDRAFCAYLIGRAEEAEALFDLLALRAASKLEQVSILDLRSVLYLTRARFAEAVDAGRRALAVLGLSLPDDEAGYAAAFDEERRRIEELLEGREIEQLVHLPALEDPSFRSALRTLMHLVSPAYVVSSTLLGLVCAMMARISIEHGCADVSAFGFMAYGVILISGMRRTALGYALGKLALSLHERFPSPDLSAKLHLAFGGNIQYACGPLRAGLPHLERAIREGLATGDFLFAAYACMHMAELKVVLGENLDVLEREIVGLLRTVQTAKDALSEAAVRVSLQYTRALLGRTNGRTTLSDHDFDEMAFTQDMTDKGMLVIACFAHVSRLELAVLASDFALAEQAADEAEKLFHTAPGQVLATELWFYGALAAAALSQKGEPEAQARRKAAFSRREAELAMLAEGCPDNYHHKLLLARAEQARAEARHAEAVALYEAAIQHASEHGFPVVEALACERAASCLNEMGARRASRPHLEGALAAYGRFGARTKVEETSARHAALFPEQASAGAATPVKAKTTLPEAATLDAATVIQAAEAIAGELELDRVIERVMHGVLQSTGAQRGVLLLERSGKLRIEATMAIGSGGFRLHAGMPVEESSELPHSIIDYVRRTKEPVVLGDTHADRRFAKDRHFAEKGPRSVLCAPMLHKGERVGILYLEHGKAQNAFTPVRLELVVFLASQAATVLQTALLYAEVQQISADLRRSNETLEGEVIRRTSELAVAAEKLRAELEQRTRAEQEREALQSRIIAVQRDRIAELSAPIIPLTEDIVVVPIIGVVDEARAAEMQDQLLQEASRRSARVVILDVTGIKEGGAITAQVLLQVDSALRLLGTRTILTGIRPDVARALVSSGASLEGLLTKGSLRAGIAHALGAGMAAVGSV